MSHDTASFFPPHRVLIREAGTIKQTAAAGLKVKGKSTPLSPRVLSDASSKKQDRWVGARLRENTEGPTAPERLPSSPRPGAGSAESLAATGVIERFRGKKTRQKHHQANQLFTMKLALPRVSARSARRGNNGPPTALAISLATSMTSSPSSSSSSSLSDTRRPFSVLKRPPPNYPVHVPLTGLERVGLAIGSGIGSFLNPYRGGKQPENPAPEPPPKKGRGKRKKKREKETNTTRPPAM